MATLEKIRSNSGCLVSAIGFALVAFIVGDFFTGGQTMWRQSQDKVVTINGERISISTYQERVNELTQVYKLRYGQNTLPQEASQQINQEVYNSLIRSTLIAEEAEKLGLKVSTEELKDMVVGEHVSPILQQLPFFVNPETGAFDKSAVANFVNTVTSVQAGAEGSEQIREAKTFWQFIERTIKSQRLEDKYVTLLSKAIMPNSLDVKSQFEGSKESVDFAYVKQSLTTIPDSLVSVSNSEIKSLYEKVKDSRYRQPETRNVKYFTVAIRPSAEDRAQVEGDINSARAEFAATSNIADFVNLNSDVPYVDAFQAVSALPADVRQFVSNSNVNDILGPFAEGDSYAMYRLVAKTTAADSAKVRHIMLPVQELEKSTALADSLMKVLNNKGNFAALAEEFSIDRNTAVNGGEIGWLTEMTAIRFVGPEFKNACFSASKNKIFKIQTSYGVHVVEVTDFTRPVAKAKVAEYALTVTPSSRTFQTLYNEISTFLANNNTIAKFEANASESNYNLMPASVQPGSYNLGMVRNARQAVLWSFRNNPGKISEVFEIDNNFVVVAVTDEVAAGYTPLSQVSDQLKRELMGPKKAEKIMADLKAKNPSSLEGYASAMNSRVDTAKFVSFNTASISGIGRESVLSGIAPYSKENQVNGPVAGKNGVYVFDVYNKIPSQSTFDAAAEKQSLESNWTYRIMYQSMKVLENKAKIEDYRTNAY